MKHRRLVFFFLVGLVTAGTGPLHLSLHLLATQADRSGHHDSHRCPECQALSNLRIVDPPAAVEDALLVLEPAGDVFLLPGTVFSDFHCPLPSIRAPPSNFR